jgi:CDP-paratose 2-epimerase
VRELQGHSLKVRRRPWRTGDQRYYVSDIRAFTEATGWRPSTDAATGVQRLHRWLISQRSAARVVAA